jgi:hypothetical protein
MSYGELQDVVSGVFYRPAWQFHLLSGPTVNLGPVTETHMIGRSLNSSGGRQTLMPPVHLVITAYVPDSGNLQRLIPVQHLFHVPDAEYPGAWDLWLLERIADVERHERCEMFQVNGTRPFYPDHGPDADLYAVHRRMTPAPAGGEQG